MSANHTKGVNLHEVRADVPDDEDGKARFAARIDALTWAQMLSADGVRRVILINELMERGISIGVRVNLAKLRERLPDAEYLTVEGPNALSVMPGSNYRPTVYTFTEQWQELPAAVAFWFHQAQQFKAELGAAFIADDYYRMRDASGELVLNWREKRHPFLAGILEFRAPADRRESGPETPSGIALTRVPVPTGALPTGAALTALPIEDEAEGDALADLAPALSLVDEEPEVTIPHRSPARRN